MENVWHHRKVAETAQKACMICFKPSSSVLVTPDSKDYFYICPAHLKDRNFALPTEDEAKAIADRKKKEEMDKEIEQIKKDYEERMKRKKEKKDKNKKKEDDKSAKTEEDGKTEEELEKEKDNKIKAVTAGPEAKGNDGPRIFRLQKHFYQMRLDKMRQAEMARRNRERLRNPGSFPAVPSSDV